MLHLILTETALEFIPEQYSTHPAAIQSQEKYKNAGKLLDTSLHHSFMHELPNQLKRGRPDILLHFLLDTLGSIANQKNHLGIHFHCSAGLFTIDPQMRCPRDYLRFKGLMAQLLQIKHIPKKPPYFITKQSLSLTNFLKDTLQASLVVKLTRSGDYYPFAQLMQKVYHQEQTSEFPVAILIGGFQKGQFSQEIMDIPGSNVSIAKQGYEGWTIVNRVLTLYEFYSKMLD